MDKRMAGDNNVRIGQGVHWLIPEKLRPLYGGLIFEPSPQILHNRAAPVAKRVLGNRRCTGVVTRALAPKTVAAQAMSSTDLNQPMLATPLRDKHPTVASNGAKRMLWHYRLKMRLRSRLLSVRAMFFPIAHLPTAKQSES